MVVPGSGSGSGSKIFEIASVVEKPAAYETSTKQALVGRYVLNSVVFDIIERGLNAHAGYELTDALAQLLGEERLLALSLGQDSVRIDCGQPSGYLRAIVTAAKKDAVLSDCLLEFFSESVE
jgi:UTP--glucose-1-phosphate uridylyltransferase